MSQKLAKYIISLSVIVLFGIATCVSQINFEVLKGKTVNDFIFTEDGVLKYKGKEFAPSVKVGDETKKFEISFLTDKGLAGAIAVNYERNSFLLLDTINATSKIIDEIPAPDKMFWSPSRKFIVIHSSYEGEWFHSINIAKQTIYKDKDWAPKNKLWYLVNSPKWLGKSDIFVFQVVFECDPYDNPNPCNDEEEYYEVQMDAATMKISKRKVRKK